MRRVALRLHAGLAWLFLGVVLVQVFLAGLGIFAGAGFGAHVEFGYSAIGIVTLAVLLSAIAARLPGREIGLCFLLLVLYVVQTALPQARTGLPVVAALHPVNAVLLFTLGGIIARRASRVPAE